MNIEIQWAIVELMGHKITAGAVMKDESYGVPMLRVDVPDTTVYPAYTQFYGLSTIYCLTPVSEAVARAAAEGNKVNPVSVYCPDLVTPEQVEQLQARYQAQLEALRRQLPEGDHHYDEEEDDGGCDGSDDVG